MVVSPNCVTFNDVLWLLCVVVLCRLCCVKVTKQLWTSTSAVSPMSCLWQRQSEIFNISAETQTPPAGCDSWERRYSIAQMETVLTYRMLPFSLLTVTRPMKSVYYLSRWTKSKVSAFAFSASEYPIRLVCGIRVCLLSTSQLRYELWIDEEPVRRHRSPVATCRLLHVLLFNYFLSTIAVRERYSLDRIRLYHSESCWHAELVVSLAIAKIRYSCFRARQSEICCLYIGQRDFLEVYRYFSRKRLLLRRRLQWVGGHSRQADHTGLQNHIAHNNGGHI